MSRHDDRRLRLFLCGDVMTGRGIDQALPHPGNPVLHEPYIGDARTYVDLAENTNGPIPRPVSFNYVWGEALAEVERADVDLRIVNLETAITSAETPWPDKQIHYRMHPRNIQCLCTAGIDACTLANNHVLDWGHEGLSETLRTLDGAEIARAGAGNDAEGALAPAVLDVPGQGRVLLFSFGSTTSGIPREWRATNTSPGMNLLKDLSKATAKRAATEMRKFQRPGDLLVASIHWGGNWGYQIPAEQIAFAHCLIEEGVAIVHGHSSHHAKAVEVFRGRLILYGCGDFLTDYEGISGYERFHHDLAVMYLIELDAESGHLVSARLVPMQMHRFRLRHTSLADAHWLYERLSEFGKQFGTRARLSGDNSMMLDWPKE